MQHHRADDDYTESILSVLSKGAWCIDVLKAVARRGSCSKTALLHHLSTIKSADDVNCTRTPVTDKSLEKCLALLEMPMFIEQNGEIVKITPRGASAAASLVGPAAISQQVEEALPKITTIPDTSLREPHALSDEIVAQAPHFEAAPQTANDNIHNKKIMATNAKDGDPDIRGRKQSDTAKPAGLRTSIGTEETIEYQDSVPENRMRGWKYRQLVVAIAALFIVMAWNYVGAESQGDSGYRFAQVKRGQLTVSTIATGSIEAVDSVEVSSQLSGQVVKLYADFNDKVAVGAPLAQLDDKTFKAAVSEAQARLAHAKASYDAAVARVIGTKARYEMADTDYKRKSTLEKKGGISAQELDKARANMVTAESDWDAARADQAVQTAAVQEADANLRKAEIDLSRTVIRSPISGTVIKRTVELGQTVAVSMKAPTLFTIARDLRHVRVNASVDEADIGRIRVGQPVKFSVDAYPNRTFAGQVVSIHRAPKIVQNVVTYTVVITAENGDLALLPGMTAIVHIVITDHPHVLLVPNAALHFQPKTTSKTSVRGHGDDRGGPQVWARTNSGKLSRVKISIGRSDGSVTEVVSGPLSEGQVVAVGRRLTEHEKTLFGIRLGF